MEIINQLHFTRQYTFSRLEQADEASWDLQPNGFNNNIRWNAGHIYMTMERILQRAVKGYEPVHVEWNALFAKGTSPASWEGAVPTNQEIIDALADQTKRVVTLMEEQLETPLAEPVKIGDFLVMETLSAVLQFLCWHEGMHAGVIHGLNRANQ